MAKQLQLRKGTATEHDTFTGANGEVTVDTTNKTLRVHDGTTAGGTRLATLTGGLVPAAQLPAATTSVQGAVILNNTLTSTSTAQALTAAQGKVLNDQAFGIGQTWQDVTASRALDTTYTNSTGKPIKISIICSVDDGILELYINSELIQKIGNIGGSLGNAFNFVSEIIPVGSTYRYNGNTFSKWSELR